MKHLNIFVIIVNACICTNVMALNAELMNDVINKMLECMSEVSKEFSLDTCQEMLNHSNDNSKPKYEDCKCFGACTSKKLGLINEDGTGNKEKLKYLIENLASDSWKTEGEVIISKCSELPGKNCELAYNFLTCVMEHSKRLTDFMKLAIGGVKKQSSEEE